MTRPRLNVLGYSQVVLAAMAILAAGAGAAAGCAAKPSGSAIGGWAAILRTGHHEKELSGGEKAYLAICFSLRSSSSLQSMQSVAVGRASRRLRPISTPQLSQ